jgi:site-specific DNA-methyltransferase (adenine-specific)
VIVHQTSRVTLHQGDARDVLADMATESVDLVVTDPPYGKEWVSSMRQESFGMLSGDGAGASDRDAVARIIGECVRVTGQNRHLYVFGPSDVFRGQLVTAAAELVWDKSVMGMGDLAQPWGSAHEPISFVVNKHRHAGEAGRETPPVRMRKGTVLRHQRPTGTSVRHPSEKPISLISELIESSSRTGETVLDPFAGSGSTVVAAVLLGRKAIAVEVDPRYVELCRTRLVEAERIRDMLERA